MVFLLLFSQRLREVKSLAEGYITVESRAENPNLGIRVMTVLIKPYMVLVYLDSAT